MQQRALTKQAVSNFLYSDTASDIQDICEPLLKMGINGVFYSRFIDRMRVNLISNHCSWLQHLHDHIDTYKEYFESQFHFRTGFSIDFLGSFIQSKMVSDMYNMNMKNAIYLTDVSDDSKYAEVFIFTTSEKNKIGNQQLIEKIGLLNAFSQSFKEQAKVIIQKTQVSNTLLEDTLVINITKRETDFIYYLILGMSQKEIAWELSVSPKTAEKYMDKIKHKLQCNSRYEIIKKAFQIPFIRVRLLNALAQNPSD